MSFIWGFPASTDAKKSACNAGDPGSIPGSGRSPGEGNSNLLHCSCLENSMDKPWGRKETHISYMRSIVIPANCFQMIQQKIKYMNIF